jgi:Arc/MetJ-type ribon-helix-helix transcriptional regulator
VKSLLVEIPERLADEIDAWVKAGWFVSEKELIRAALLDFVRARRLELQEQFQLEDIEWALRQVPSAR